MNQLVVIVIEGLKLILTIMPIIGVVCGVIKIKKKKRGVFQLICVVGLGISAYLFLVSHSTWIMYNDWWILGEDIEKIQSRYGAFDYEAPGYDESGHAGYHVFYNNGPIMPDYLNYYYIMEYDEENKVYAVYISAQPGG